MFIHWRMEIIVHRGALYPLPIPSSCLVLSLSPSWSFVSNEQHAVSDWAFFGLPASGGYARFEFLGPSLLSWEMRTLPSSEQPHSLQTAAEVAAGSQQTENTRNFFLFCLLLPAPSALLTHIPLLLPDLTCHSQLTVPMRQDCEAGEMVLLIKYLQLSSYARHPLKSLLHVIKAFVVQH